LDKQHSNIRFIKFRDSSYALDPVLEEIESKGLQGDKVLLEGKVKKKQSGGKNTNELFL